MIKVKKELKKEKRKNEIFILSYGKIKINLNNKFMIKLYKIY